MIRKAKAIWRGTGRDGTGNLSSDSGVLANTPYSFKTRFESEKGTNPEELIAAAHAGCFTMALAFQLQGAGFTPTELNTEAAVSLEPEGQGFRISRSALTLRAKVPNLDEATFKKLAGLAEKNCPVSKALNAEITLDASWIDTRLRCGTTPGNTAKHKENRAPRFPPGPPRECCGAPSGHVLPRSASPANMRPGGAPAR
jgi:osmotically inducible protein OsmC